MWEKKARGTLRVSIVMGGGILVRTVIASVDTCGMCTQGTCTQGHMY